MQIITDQHKKETKRHGTHDFPFLISHERLSAYESGAFLWHWHPELELTLVTEGQMLYRVNGAVFHLKAGDVLLVNSGCLHSASMYGPQDCSYIPVTFDPKLIYGYESSLLYSRYIRPILQNSALSAVHFDGSGDWHREAAELTRELIRTGSLESSVRELDIQLLLTRFWRILFLHSSSLSAHTAVKEDLSYARIRQMLSCIEEHYASRLTLEDIAASVCLCKGECCRIFRQYMKLSLFEFLQQYRIEKSLPLLADPSRTVTEVAGLTGFSDSNYFAKVFRKQKGCSPTEYRRQTSL